MTNDELEDAFWKNDNTRSVVREEITPTPPRIYDLEERTAQFGEAVLAFANATPRTPVTRPLSEQLVACETSIGANHCEADDVQKKNFDSAVAPAKRRRAKQSISRA